MSAPGESVSMVGRSGFAQCSKIWKKCAIWGSRTDWLKSNVFKSCSNGVTQKELAE